MPAYNPMRHQQTEVAILRAAHVEHALSRVLLGSVQVAHEAGSPTVRVTYQMAAEMTVAEYEAVLADLAATESRRRERAAEDAARAERVAATTARWVSCSRDADWTAAQYRHLITVGALTTFCGATGSHADVWRGNSTKPDCPRCMEVNRER